MCTNKAKGFVALSVQDLRSNTEHILPVHPGGYVDAADLACIKNQQGSNLLIYDEGSRNTACVKSTVSHLDAVTGSLQYRQYAIEDLFGKYGFAENTSLLVYGFLPDDKQIRDLHSLFAQSMLKHLEAIPCIQSFPKNAPMMTMIFGGISACAALNPHLIPVHSDRDIYSDDSAIKEHTVRTLSALAVVICASYCHQRSLPMRKPQPDWTLIENMLYMMCFTANEDIRPDPEQVRLLEALILLHSEHGTCNATVAFLHTASTRADPLSALLAGLASIYGPMHGGSNIVTYHQLQKIGSVDRIPEIIEEVKNRKRRLYGFGHRIYRVIDPRATLLKQFLQDRASSGVKSSPLLDVALQLEHIVNTDAFFTARHLKANTDLYTVLAYDAIGIPENLVFPFICLSRSQGFLAHWRELLASSPTPWRPQQIYTGPPIQRESKL